jgi:hypothetical protein
MEYLVYAVRQSEVQLSDAQVNFAGQLAATKEVEDKARGKQEELAIQKNALRLKRHTLKTYKGVLETAKELPVEVFKCKVCFKYFASQMHLEAHYKRRHPDSFKVECTKT